MTLSFSRRCLLLIVPLLLLAALAALRLRSGVSGEAVSRSRLLMGTVVEITARDGDRGRLEAAVDAAFAEMARIEALMSPQVAASDVARLSAAAVEAEVAPETAEVVALALEVAAASRGAFDPALGRLKALWGVESEAPRLPGAGEIRAALAGTGPGGLALTGTGVRKRDAALAVDLGGIAKGYAIDRAVEVLRRAGVTSAAVNAGGDIGLVGDNGGRPWRIGIQHPRRSGGLLATLSLAGTAVVTSGDYERFFERDGVRYHHLFDPRTGRPAARSQSATVVAESAALADALATAAFVLGPGEGLELLGRYPGVEGMVVGADGSVHLTPGLRPKVSWP